MVHKQERRHNRIKIALLAVIAAGVVAIVAMGGYYVYPVPYETMQKSTVRVTMLVDGNVAGHCSGVYLGDGRVLTAGHCNRGPDFDVYISTYDAPEEYISATWEKSVLKTGDHVPLEDLGVLKVEEDIGVPTVTVRCDDLSVGAEVYAVGHPKNLRWTVTRGTVTTNVPRDAEAGDNWIQMDVTILKGNSGGPVFDRFGRLVGIMSHTMIAGHGRMGAINSPHSYAASGEEICKFIGTESEDAGR